MNTNTNTSVVASGQSDEIEIDLLRLLGALWHHVWIIVASILVCGALVFAVTFFLVTPQYTSTAMMYVNNSSFSVGSTSVSLTDLNASKSLVDTYLVILRTRYTLNEVIQRAGVDLTYEDLYEKITADSVDNTEVFSISVTDPDPQLATRIANTITEVLPERVSDIIDGSSARTVDFAVVPAKKSSPNVTRNTAIGMLVGLVLSCGAICVLELMDDQIRSDEFLTESFGYSMLAIVPDLMETGGKKGYYSYRSYGRYGGSYGRSASYAQAASSYASAAEKSKN